MLLEIEHLKVQYGKAVAVEDVSLSVDQGEVVSIVGANGAGKSTIIRTVSGLKKPAAGEIYFEGKRVDGRPSHELVRMGVVQIPAGRLIFGPMTVLDNLKSGAYLRRDREGIKRDIEEIYTHFPILEERKNQMGGQLSGGQQQMLAIARALMAKPKLLMMDEPSIGLSPKLVAEVSRIIRTINRSGISVLLVEQNARMALHLSSRAYVLELGRVVLEGRSSVLVNDQRVKEYYLGGMHATL
jgi:branched-chain amino acid transport system ATP-binding protein